ncbi:MAG: hypothetical protein IJJ33_18610 [Victivallales bacterium]|nr:hypothetical protein [Victivallales bacterium]
MEHMHFKRMRNVCAQTVGRFMVFALLLFLLWEASSVYGQEKPKAPATKVEEQAVVKELQNDGTDKSEQPPKKSSSDNGGQAETSSQNIEKSQKHPSEVHSQEKENLTGGTPPKATERNRDIMTSLLGSFGAMMIWVVLGVVFCILVKFRDRKPVPSSQLVSMDTLRKELSAIIKSSRPEVPAVQSSTKTKQRDEEREKAVQEQKKLLEEKSQLEENLANAEKERKELSAEKKQLEEKLANAKKEREALSAAKEQLEENLAEAEEESGKRKRACEQEKSGREVAERQLAEARNELGTTNQKLVDAQRQCETLKSKMYPKELLSNEAFGILKGHLEEWLANQSSGALLARAELQAFGTRALLPNWPQSLNNLAIGISAAMREAGKGEQEIFEELSAWSKFLGMFSDNDFDFFLRVPKLGENIDRSWMHCKNRDSAKVQKIISWAVFHNEKGIQSSAEVE